MRHLPKTVWILSSGRFLSEIGTGFTVFYGPIVFVNQVGLTATDVGVCIGAASIVGIGARIASGSLCDWEPWGCKKTLLLSGVVSAIGSFILANTDSFMTLLIGNLFAGAGLGFYWPASEATIAATTAFDQHRDAYTLARFADNLGLGIGVVLGSFLVSVENAYRWLFTVDGLSYLLFTAIALVALPAIVRLPAASATPERVLEDDAIGVEAMPSIPSSPRISSPPVPVKQNPVQNWFTALRDRTLLIYLAVNLTFTIYVSQVQATLPLFLSNVLGASTRNTLAPEWIGVLFTGHIVLTALLQLPVARWLHQFSHTQALRISSAIWAIGLVGLWGLSVLGVSPIGVGVFSLAMFALAIVAYTPSASSLVALMAPDHLRGIYLSLNSLCWALGYTIGPPLGGMAIDAGEAVATLFWLLLAGGTGVMFAALAHLDRRLPTHPH